MKHSYVDEVVTNSTLAQFYAPMFS